MTFRGLEYETVLDMKRCLITAQAELKAFQLIQRNYRLQRDKENTSEMDIKINLQTKFIEELEKLINDVCELIDHINDNLSDIEAMVFQQKFILGKNENEICSYLCISRSTFYNHLANIKNLLDTEQGRKLLALLKKK